jgi:hypothetical protein
VLAALTFVAGFTAPDVAPHNVVMAAARPGEEPARIFMPAMKPTMLLTVGQGLPGDHRRCGDPDLPGGQHFVAGPAEIPAAASAGPCRQTFEASFRNHAVAAGARDPRAPPPMTR